MGGAEEGGEEEMTLHLLVAAIPYVLSLAAVVGTFYGIIHTNSVNVRLQNDRLAGEDRKQNRELLRAKGEELYLLIDDHEKAIRKTLLEVFEAHRQTLHPTTYGDCNATSSQLQRIEMLTNVYFPSALDALGKLTSYRQKLSNLTSQLRQNSDYGRRDYLTHELLNLSEEIQDHSQTLQTQVMEFLGTLHADLWP